MSLSTFCMSKPSWPRLLACCNHRTPISVQRICALLQIGGAQLQIVSCSNCRTTLTNAMHILVGYWILNLYFFRPSLLGFRQVVAQVCLCISELCRNMLSLRIGSIKREQMDPYTVQYLSMYDARHWILNLWPKHLPAASVANSHSCSCE